MKNNYLKQKFKVVLILMWTMLGSGLIDAVPLQENQEYIYPARTRAKPVINGILDDEAWQTPPLEKNFVSFYPVFGETFSQPTRIWISYDDKNLYFAFLCHDAEPEKIKTSLTKRDNMFEDDWVGVSIDTYGNRQASYNFYSNPNGIQGDMLESAVSGADQSPDFVWESAAKLTAQGYQVEICIPLKSISFNSGREVKMGVLFKRRISRLSVNGSWPEVRAGEGKFNAYAAVIYQNLKRPLKFELLPSVTHSNNRERLNLTEWKEKELSTDFGIGLSYGITSAVTGELTINPDFSQVESDAFQVEVNRRYPVFYSEKRPFFMEGMDIFNFFTAHGGYLPYPVYTRQIVDPLWGTKLTGTLGNISFGILSAADEWPGPHKRFFGIARGKYSASADNYIGFLYSGNEMKEEYNRVFGADIGYRLFKNHRINASFLHSVSGGSAPREPGNTNSSDFNLMYGFRTNHVGITAGFEHIGRDFRMDSAFLKRNGINESWVWHGYYLHPRSRKLSWLKQISPWILVQYLHDLYTHKNDPFIEVGVDFSFIKQGSLGVYYSYWKENWQDQEFELGQLSLNGGILLTRWLQIEGILTRGDIINYDAVPSYQGKGWNGSFSLVLQPNKNLNQQFKFSHADLSKDKEKIYDVNILYSRTTYQFNRYLLVRGVIQYNSYLKRMLTDFLVSFTLIPGTVFHIGYGSLYEGRKWQDNNWLYRQGDLLNIKRSFFAKISYLWRL